VKRSAIFEALGLRPGDRAVILSGEKVGFSYSHTSTTIHALREGSLTSARLQVPAPWSRGAVGLYRGEDIGVDLVLTAENPIFHFGPLTFGATLIDGSGGFPATVEDLWEHADPDEVHRELRAQLERAILWGFDITHLGSHGASLLGRPEFFDIFTDVAAEFALPIRMHGQLDEAHLGFPAASLAHDKGVYLTDDVIEVMNDAHLSFASGAELAESLLERLRPGITDITLEVAEPTSELQALQERWELPCIIKTLVWDRQLRDALSKAGVELLSYHALRDAVRATRREF
jgi:predicted glycoside hydrolase/deacetylase ChbG (UPF0249 family)